MKERGEGDFLPRAPPRRVSCLLREHAMSSSSTLINWILQHVLSREFMIGKELVNEGGGCLEYDEL